MNKTLSVVLALTLAVGISHQARAEQEKAKPEEVLSAIDVAALVEGGASDAEIVRQLSEQRGVDTAAPVLKGKTDQQRIYILLNLPAPSKKNADKGRTSVHKTAGENLFKKGDYAKAAQEFSLATKYMSDNLEIDKYDLYRLRGDSYKEFIRGNLSPAIPLGRAEASKTSFGRKRTLMCGAVYSDYRTASDLLDRSIRDGINEMERRNVRMQELKKGSDPTLQYKSKSSEYINMMREMRRILYRQSLAKSAGRHLNEALDDYRKVCPAEEQARRDQVRAARDKSRDRKWVGYGEINNAIYFYDKNSLKKAKDGVTVWSRKDTFDDDISYDLVRVKLNCGKKTFVTLETSSYGPDGNQTSKKEYKKAIEKKAASGTPEELLLVKICR